MISAYLGALILALLGPLLLSFYPPLKFYRHKSLLLKTICTVAAPFIVWDLLAVYFQHWSFEQSKVYPWSFINIPLEEVLFFFVIPFCCIFTWEVVLYFSRNKQRK